MMSRSRTFLFFLTALAVFASYSPAQVVQRNVVDVVAQGRVAGYQYQNDYFGLTITVEHAKFTAPSFVQATAQRARLVDALCDSTDWDSKYSIGVVADSLAVNPQIKLPTDYLNIFRHRFEKEGEQMVGEESAVDIAGVKFVAAVLKSADTGRTHFHGVYVAFQRGYIVLLDVTAASPERLNKVLADCVKWKKPDA
jgi:hypothetical protein